MSEETSINELHKKALAPNVYVYDDILQLLKVDD